MKGSIEINFKNFIDSDGSIEDLIYEKIAKLEKICDRIISCHAAIEQIKNNQKHGHTYHIRIDLSIPPHHQLAVVREPNKGKFQHVKLAVMVRDAFDALRRQVQEIVDRQKKKIKAHSKLKTIELVEDN